MHHLEKRQIISSTLEETWGFFSDPGNLALITPPEMGFRVIRTTGDKTYPGMIIVYKVRPLLGIPLTWVTEITHVRDMAYFVDEQRVGPYRLWHHQHHFRKVEGGIEMVDKVDYALPLGFLGRGINRLLVRKKLEKIFTFREIKIRELFG